MRQLIVVDIETTGLGPDAAILEVAAALPHEEFYMVPHVYDLDIKNDGPALAINRYFERKIYESMSTDTETTLGYRELWNILEGNTLAGSNPRFDAGLLSREFRRHGIMPAEPWHHRLADLSAYAAGALGIAPSDLPGLDTVCQALGIKNLEPHSAMGDAMATRACFEKLSA